MSRNEGMEEDALVVVVLIFHENAEFVRTTFVSAGRSMHHADRKTLLSRMTLHAFWNELL